MGCRDSNLFPSSPSLTLFSLLTTGDHRVSPLLPLPGDQHPPPHPFPHPPPHLLPPSHSPPPHPLAPWDLVDLRVLVLWFCFHVRTGHIVRRNCILWGTRRLAGPPSLVVQLTVLSSSLDLRTAFDTVLYVCMYVCMYDVLFIYYQTCIHLLYMCVCQHCTIIYFLRPFGMSQYAQLLLNTYDFFFFFFFNESELYIGMDFFPCFFVISFHVLDELWMTSFFFFFFFFGSFWRCLRTLLFGGSFRCLSGVKAILFPVTICTLRSPWRPSCLLCVCVRERERERESVGVCVWEWVRTNRPVNPCALRMNSDTQGVKIMPFLWGLAENTHLEGEKSKQLNWQWTCVPSTSS